MSFNVNDVNDNSSSSNSSSHNNEEYSNDNFGSSNGSLTSGSQPPLIGSAHTTSASQQTSRNRCPSFFVSNLVVNNTGIPLERVKIYMVDLIQKSLKTRRNNLLKALRNVYAKLAQEDQQRLLNELQSMGSFSVHDLKDRLGDYTKNFLNSVIKRKISEFEMYYLLYQIQFTKNRRSHQPRPVSEPTMNVQVADGRQMRFVLIDR
ncbi:hypothetical protein SAMD00019534_125460 [Acytostelium subglobosum LB1]|uniref:hypothetical protein n=1 Tax=Acytostelium subglobosum LB1 TaxID=1410327 RepID=UPI000645107B|nr:hypothetical protein SAMD00019534_125460 [Acytostelium subglobosum LB1]GAM29370.1 hypothetical protein SAMD00019534_125460 [Acytostelium subglobosum LB1]|eukprot:XP_012747675.1 hypothetical protein SAMD00019534_125460 [Acytostelium subglobosum LB1]